MKPKLKVDFFHDVICGWCYVLSPRLRQLEKELDLDVHHHAFALSPSKEHMKESFGSIKKAKEAILGHWEQCAIADDKQRINVEGMRRQSFEYPTSMPGLLACKAILKQAGQQQYWDYFDAVQHAHMSENRNIADPEVLISLAGDLGLDTERFERDWQAQERQVEIERDRKLAKRYQIQSVPSLVVDNRLVMSGAQPLNKLRQQLKQIQRK